MRSVLPASAIVALAFLLGGCGSSEDTLESLAGTPAAIHIVKDLEAMAQACKQPNKQTRSAGVAAYTNLAKITSIHPNATFGPEDTEVTMRGLLRHTVEKTGHCIGVSVDSKGRYRVE